MIELESKGQKGQDTNDVNTIFESIRSKFIELAQLTFHFHAQKLRSEESTTICLTLLTQTTKKADLL